MGTGELVAVQVGGRGMTTLVGVEVGSSALTGRVGGGNGLSEETGLVKMTRNPAATQTAIKRIKMVRMLQNMA
jgi:hypothetical protein